jgi:hypothetical protein
MVPEELQLSCCTKLGSTPVNANGSLGCPFNANFVDLDLNATYARVQASCLDSNNVSNSGFLCNDIRVVDPKGDNITTSTNHGEAERRV